MAKKSKQNPLKDVTDKLQDLLNEASIEHKFCDDSSFEFKFADIYRFSIWFYEIRAKYNKKVQYINYYLIAEGIESRDEAQLKLVGDKHLDGHPIELTSSTAEELFKKVLSVKLTVEGFSNQLKELFDANSL